MATDVALIVTGLQSLSKTMNARGRRSLYADVGSLVACLLCCDQVDMHKSAPNESILERPSNSILWGYTRSINSFFIHPQLREWTRQLEAWVRQTAAPDVGLPQSTLNEHKIYGKLLKRSVRQRQGVGGCRSCDWYVSCDKVVVLWDSCS